MHVAVIGAGPIGAATARYLATFGHDVTLIGPPEPADRNGPGPFASHYDEGRIARIADYSPLWARIKAASIGRFGEIEAAAGLPFFTRSGAMMAGDADGPLLRRTQMVQLAQGIAAERLPPARLAERFPFFDFGSNGVAIHEPQSGWINPRRLVAAQILLARRAGARLLATVARDIEETATGVRVVTDAGPVTADHAVIAAGAFSRDLTGAALPLEVYARTVLFLELAPEDAATLASMPCVVIEAEDGREPYLLPPIPYPDGGLWLKIGGDPVDRPLAPNEVLPWFRTEGSPEVAAHLRAILDRVLPGLAPRRTRTEACAVTFTPEDRPLAGPLSARITLATAGCARGAKGSDEIGRLAAEAVLGHGLAELAP